MTAATLLTRPAAAVVRPVSEAGEVRVEVVTVTLAGRLGSPVVIVKESDSTRALPIYIGSAEATAIWQRLNGERAPRPLTHDLLKTLLDAAELHLDRAVITGMAQETYHAALHLRKGWRRFAVDSRPSDAIAVALRCGRPIYVSRRLMRSPASFDLAARPRPVQAGGLTLQEVTPALAARLGVEAGAGALVADVREGRFAAVLRRGDVLVALGGRPVRGPVDALLRLHEVRAAAPLRLIVLRGGRRLAVTAPGGYPRERVTP